MKNIFQKSGNTTLFVIFNVVVVVIVLLLCEGLSSLVLVAQSTSFTAPVAERMHTQYDETLGWVNRPDSYIKDMYGPGLDLRINGQGFRAVQDFSPSVPDGQLRVICSGDSFTLGYGVDDYNNWCQLLDSINPAWQTVNMGQGGYGVGQAYLWSKRDAAKLNYNIHLFTFITRDFERMQQTEFLGYGKPLLRVENDALVVDNVPVPKRAFYIPWLTQNGETLNQLKIVQLLSQLLAPTPVAGADTPPGSERDAERVVSKIIEDLARINQKNGSTLVLVYLPTWGDYDPLQTGRTDAWREHIRQVAQEQEIVFFDLVEEFRLLPANRIYTLFLHEDAVNFPGAAGHYSVHGNEFIARRLFEKLSDLLLE